MGKIVVGVDGSAPSSAALDWAIAEAKLRGSTLDIVVSWDYPVMATAEPIIVPLADRETLVSTATAVAETMLNHAGLKESGVAYEVFTPEGRAGDELVHMSGDAELLVVGSYGSGVLKELIMGSVSSYCVHHSVCPVVLVRTPE
ncbi:MAG TPA: universal stress protein [Ilumatobacteraceae bacterium]